MADSLREKSERRLADVARSERGACRSSSKVSSRKRSPGTGLQIQLEDLRSFYIGELDRRDEFPRSAVGAMLRQPGVVRSESRLNVRCKSGVVPVLMDCAQKDVDVALFAHAAGILLGEASRSSRSQEWVRLRASEL